MKIKKIKINLIQTNHKFRMALPSGNLNDSALKSSNLSFVQNDENQPPLSPEQRRFGPET